MDAQEARGACHQGVADGLTRCFLTGTESVEGVAFEDAVDGAVIVVAGLFVLVDGAAGEESG